MRSSKVLCHDPTGRRMSEDEIPRIGEVVTKRVFNMSEPNILTIVTEPCLDWLNRNKLVQDDAGEYETLQARLARLAKT